MTLVCDFDATLAARATDPWATRILPRAQRVLRRLVRAGGVEVVFLSGRRVPDLAERIRVGGATYLGDHGVERAVAARGFRPWALAVETTPTPPAAAAMADELARRVPELVGAHGLVVERKSGGVTFHFRQADDLEAAGRSVADAVGHVDGAGVLGRVVGRRSVELRSHGAPTKATTLTRLIRQRAIRSLIAIGDGRDDAQAWSAARTAMGRRGSVLAIAVAGYPDVTLEVAPRADIVLASPADVAALLSALAALVADPSL